MKTQQARSAPLDMNRWREMIEAWDKSGETQKAFCKRAGININTFVYARGKLLKHSKPKAAFVPLTIKNEPEHGLLQLTVVLENARGYKLHLPASLSLDQLTKLFKLSGWFDA